MLVPHAAIQARAYHVVNERIPGNQFRINPAEKLDPREQASCTEYEAFTQFIAEPKCTHFLGRENA